MNLPHIDLIIITLFVVTPLLFLVIEVNEDREVIIVFLILTFLLHVIILKYVSSGQLICKLPSTWVLSVIREYNLRIPVFIFFSGYAIITPFVLLGLWFKHLLDLEAKGVLFIYTLIFTILSFVFVVQAIYIVACESLPLNAFVGWGIKTLHSLNIVLIKDDYWRQARIFQLGLEILTAVLIVVFFCVVLLTSHLICKISKSPHTKIQLKECQKKWVGFVTHLKKFFKK